MRPVPSLADKDGNLIHDSEGRAERWMEHCCEIEAAKKTTVAELHKTTLQRLQKHLERVSVPDLNSSLAHMEVAGSFAKVKRGKAFGHDVTPADVYALAPQRFSNLYHSLMWKSSAFSIEPLQFKGGMLIDLYKGKGTHSACKNKRGILLIDNLGKKHTEKQ